MSSACGNAKAAIARGRTAPKAIDRLRIDHVPTVRGRIGLDRKANEVNGIVRARTDPKAIGVKAIDRRQTVLDQSDRNETDRKVIDRGRIDRTEIDARATSAARPPIARRKN